MTNRARPGTRLDEAGGNGEGAGVVRPLGRAAVAVAAWLLAGLLSGCAQHAPGVAAEVGDERITDEQVDELAEALCVLNAGGAEGAPVPTQQVRRQALQILLDTELARGVVDADAVDREQLAAARQQAAASREALPERLRGTFDEAVEGFATSQLGLVELGRESLAEEGGADADEQAALAEGQRLRAEHAEEVGVSVDPRFGTWAEGQVQPSDGSLSVAVSDQARASATDTPAAATDLPANLTCSAG